MPYLSSPGHIRGLTNTLPLHVEILYNEYNFQGAFAVASVLTALALVTLVLKAIVGGRRAPYIQPDRRSANGAPWALKSGTSRRRSARSPSSTM